MLNKTYDCSEAERGAIAPLFIALFAKMVYFNGEQALYLTQY